MRCGIAGCHLSNGDFNMKISFHALKLTSSMRGRREGGIDKDEREWSVVLPTVEKKP
jgi:hypothetical protein